MLRIIKSYILQNDLLSPSATVIVGLSGGADSMAMLDVLTLLGYRCIAAHCNFHLRGEESDRDADFVKKWCKSIDIEFVSIDFDTTGYASDKKISIEMAARELRYRWFEIIRSEYQAEAIAVAHHRDDSVETVLMNLVRGTGIKGLTGIAPKNEKIIRPMLCTTRQQIETYLKNRSIPFVIDSTNNEDLYTRNYLRLNVLPMLQKLNPSVTDAIFRTSQNLREAEKMYHAATERAKSIVFDGEKIDITALLTEASPISVLFEILAPLGFNPTVIEDVCGALQAESGKIFVGERFRIIKDRDFLLLDPISTIMGNEDVFYIQSDTREMEVPIHLIFSQEKKSVPIKKNRLWLYADMDKLAFPLVLRRWQQGDWFIPFGMKGRKKLSDYFSDQKFSLKDKENAWILVSDKEIVWIVGERSDNRIRVTDKTENVFIAQFVTD